MTYVSLRRTFNTLTSPLGLLLYNDRTNRLLAQLSGHLDELRKGTAKELTLNEQELDYARNQWEEAVLKGERQLHALAGLLAERLTGTQNLQPVARIVAGPKVEIEQGARIVIEETVSRERLMSTTDFGLSTDLVNAYRYRPQGSDDYERLYARASFLEFRPLTATENSLAARVMTRVKANDSIWNKVCDALFDIDNLVERDKILNPRSKYIKDVFGIKVLTHHQESSYAAEEALNQMSFTAAELSDVGGNPFGTRLELIERKDYLGGDPRFHKQTGWRAIKNVYRWCDALFEVQFQTEQNYFLEVHDLSDASRRTFDMQRRQLRWDLEDKVNHYADYRRLLKAIFTTDEAERREAFAGFDFVKVA